MATNPQKLLTLPSLLGVVGPLCSQCPLYLCSLFLIKTHSLLKHSMSGNSFPTHAQTASTSLPITRATFLDHTHHSLSNPISEQKGPLGLVFPSQVPCLVTRNSHCPWAGCLLCPGEASVVSGLRNNRFLCGLPHTARRPAPAYQPLPCGWAQGCPRRSH